MNYNNENTLRDYALWYYFRYYPSNKRLEQKLLEKSDNAELTKTIIDSISHLLLEDKILPAKIDNYIYRNKNYRYIEQKMREKLFPVDKVSEYLEKYRNSGESLLKDDFLERKIKIFKQKGKSNTYIMNKLGETKLDREKLEKMLESYSDNEALRKELEKILSLNPIRTLAFAGADSPSDTFTFSKVEDSPLPLSSKGAGGNGNKNELNYKEKQKIIEKLLRKGFKYGDIKKELE